jgi:hypothetical protein
MGRSDCAERDERTERNPNQNISYASKRLMFDYPPVHVVRPEADRHRNPTINNVLGFNRSLQHFV